MSFSCGKVVSWSHREHAYFDHELTIVAVGPYVPAVLRFGVFFPPGYPESPPLVTFVTDIFHPLVTPSTTYTCTPGSSSSDTASHVDGEHLAPGDFALSSAFPYWFVRSERGSTSSIASSRNASAIEVKADASDDGDLPSSAFASKGTTDHRPSRPSIATVLDFIRRAFDDEEVLDALPAEAVANPGAWKAWQAHRHAMSPKASNDHSITLRVRNELKGQVKQPDDWSWDGVWERRVRKGVDASISDQVLFGASGGDEMVGP